MLAAVFFGSAIAGAGWAQFLALQGPLHLGLNFHGQARLAILVIVLAQALAVLAALVGTFLGWIAVTQIRRSAGRLYGLGLAVFDGLLFPLLALNGVIIWLANVLADRTAVHLIPVLGRTVFSITLLTLTALACAAATLLISRYVWRAAKQSG